LFFYSGKSKLFDDDGHAPPAVKEQFEGTFVRTFPGIDVLWVIIGILEVGIFALSLSLLPGEFLPRNQSCYFSSAAIFILVLLLPPNSPRNRLTTRRTAASTTRSPDG
jgi:hypothetical protein